MNILEHTNSIFMIMSLKLIARLSYIEGKRAHFVYADDDNGTSASRDKLIRACGGWRDGIVYAHTNEGFHLTADNIGEFVGLDCIVRVKVVSYKFTSTYEKNRGETINGFRLTLKDLALLHST